MIKLSSSIRAKFTLIFISILCFSCITSVGIVILATPKLSEYVAISNSPGTILLLLVTVLLCAAIGSLLMFIATKLISKPIEHISDLTKEIAKGNFDVQIHYKSEDEIGILANNFNLMTKELKNMEYLRKDFISNVSHEFKTPIASIQGFAEIIKDKNLPPGKFEEYVDIIIEETKRLNNLSSNMMRLSRLDNQVIQNNRRLFSLDEQLRKTVLLLEEYWSKKNLELDIDLEEVSFDGDEELVQQVWLNIIGNAIKFSYDNGTIYLSLKENPKTIVVEIRDEGIGISEESKERIFERFYQGDSSRSKAGSGLGLAIVKKIIEICGGSIAFESKLGEGTRFIVRLDK